ncbi:MAG: phosphoenolpyruvate--protein phosphotransferase [bacterium]
MDKTKSMKTIQGVSASSGIAIGTICLYSTEHEGSIPHYLISLEQVENEVKRVSDALQKTESSVTAMIEKSKEASDTQAAGIFTAHLAIIKDPGILKKISDLIRTNLINAEHAVNDVFESYIEKYKKTKSHFAELAHDLIDIKNDLIESFGSAGGHFVCETGDRQAVIVASKTLVPSMIMDIPRENVLAFVTEEGGYTTHATILARSYGVPVVFGIPVDHLFTCGDRLIVDGSSGRLILNPDEETEKYYRFRIEKIKQRRLVCDSRKSLPSATKEGKKVKLKVNVSIPHEMTMLHDIYYDGIGLLRTEFLFQSHQPPSEEEQYLEYKKILEEAASREVVVRLLDVGPDKLPPYLHLPPQTNPDLGIRGARAVDFFYDIYLTQAKALLRAGTHGDLKILFPMVSDLHDFMSYENLLTNARNQLQMKKKTYKCGVMIETPSSALLAESFIQEVDFVNIGSNDLLQYTLAASRGNAFAEQRYHIMHPALIRLFQIIIAAGKKHNKEVCLCGEIASFEEYYPLFLSLGLRSFSVPAAKYEEIKCALSFLKSKPHDPIIKKLLQAKTKTQIDRIFH